MIRASTATEVKRLIGELAHEGPNRDAAIARLAIIGARSIDRLIEYVKEAPSAGARAAALRTLEAIGDPRALGAAAPWVESADVATALAAISVHRLHVLTSEPDVSAAALDALTAVALDAGRDEAVRIAAIDGLATLPADVTAPLFQRLEKDRSAAVRDRVSPGSPDATARVPDESLETLARGGVLPDPDAMRIMVARAPKVPIATLHRLIGLVRIREASMADPQERARWAVARAALHQALAARGSRVALYDLREAIEAGDTNLPVGFLAALQAIGDVSCLDGIAAAYVKARASGGDWSTGPLLETLRHIIAREKLTRRHAALRRFDARYPGVLDDMASGASTPLQTTRMPSRAGRT